MRLNRLLATLLVVVCCLTALPVAVASDVVVPDIPVGSAQAAFLFEPTSDLVLYEKDADKRMYPASTTKMMTALLTLEYFTDLNTLVTIEEIDFAGVESDASKAGFWVGEEVPVLDLLYGLMLPSGNEAANTLARVIAGDVPTFANMMNQRAKALGCTGTHFVNPNGLHDDDHYTTARDLALIAEQAMMDSTFRDIVTTAQKTMTPTTQQPNDRKVYTTNMLIFRRSDDIYYEECLGIKTGYTSDAGYCFVSAAEEHGITLISVVLGCDRGEQTYASSFYQTKDMFTWAFENYRHLTLIDAGAPIAEVPVELSTESDALVLVTSRGFTGLAPKGSDIDDFEQIIDVPEVVRAPITAGDAIGTITLKRDGVVYDTVALVALHDVALSEVLFYADQMNTFLQSHTFVYIILGVIVFLIVYFLLLTLRKRALRKRRRRWLAEKRRAQAQEQQAREEEWAGYR